MSEILVHSAPRREMADNDGPGAADNSSLTPVSAAPSASASPYLHIPHSSSPYPSHSPSYHSPANIPLPPSSSPVPAQLVGGRNDDEPQLEEAEPGVSPLPAAAAGPSSSPAASDHHRVVDAQGLHGTHVTLQTVEMVDPLAGLDDDDDDDKEDVGVVRVDDGEEPQPASQRFAAARAISSTLPLSLPSAEEEEEEKEKFSTHRPLPILTSGPAFHSAIPQRAASSLAAFPASHIPLVPAVPAAPFSDGLQLQLPAPPAVTEEEKAQYETLSLHELRTPISGGSDDNVDAAALGAEAAALQQPGQREADEEWDDAAYDDDVKASALPPLAAAASGIGSLDISYGTAAPELLPAVASGYEYDDSGDSVGATLGSGSEQESLGGTTVPYAGTASAPYAGMSDTYIPAPPVGDLQFTYQDGVQPAGTLPPPPYTEQPTALSPQELHPLSPQSHRTGSEVLLQSPALLRPGSAHSSGPHTPLTPAQQDEYKATASSITSYSDAPLRRAASPYNAEPQLLTRRASYEYTAADGAGVQEMLERGEGQGEGGAGDLTSEEKEPGLPAEMLAEGVPGVAELEHGYAAEEAAPVDELELMRASSALAEQWRREDAAVAAAALVQADAAAAAALAKEQGDEGNRNREGQAGAASPGVRPRGASGRSGRRSGRSGSQAAKTDIPHWPVFMSLIIAVDVTLLVAMIGYDGWSLASLYDNPMYGPQGSTLLHFGAKFTPALLEHSQGWRLLVSCLLHSGVIHLVFSIGIAFMYLSQLEKEHGWFRVGLVFLTSGIFSQLFSALLNPTYVSVGGGAALMGVVSSWLGDFVHSFHQLQGPWQYFIRNVLSTGIVFAAGVFPFNDNWGSIGGLIAGVLAGLAFYFPLHRSQRTGKWRIHHVRVWVPALVVLLASIGAIAAALYGQSASAAYSQHGNAHWISCVDTPYWSCSAGVPSNCFNAQGNLAGGNSTYC